MENEIIKVIEILKKNKNKFKSTALMEISKETDNDPFKVLISCLLSLRTKDKVTAEASKRLYGKAGTAEEILKLSVKEIEKLIYPVGFYKTKAGRIKEICKEIIEKYNGKVPDTLDALLKLKGVGRKTANIVMVYGHNKKYHIPVDVHVHRISNRLGWVKTKKPEETERELMSIIPKKYWQDFNDLFVQYGQNICLPVSPFCSRCFVKDYCKRAGVEKSR